MLKMNKYIIIVPAYNCELYVEETLKSLMGQGDDLRRVDRVILTDDCSTDRTIEVAKATWKSAVPLEVYSATENRGEYKNMNECISRLPDHIEWYLVMHADNLAKPGWLKALLDAADIADDKIGTIFTSWDNWYEDGRIVEGENRIPYAPECIEGNDLTVADTIKRGCWWHISSCATRVQTYREIGGLPVGFRLKGDWDFLMRLLGSGWNVEYLPRALMTYRMNPTGSSSLSFRRHQDVYETLNIANRHQHTMSARSMALYHAHQLKTLFRRLVGGMLRRQPERALKTFPASLFVLCSLGRCMKEQWLGRRHFRWVSSSDPMMNPQLQVLSAAMSKFYSLTSTRDAYQVMIDAESSAQPLTEGELRKAVLHGDPSAVLEVGCGSGRIYERLRAQGLKGSYTGVEMSPEVIASNQQRFPDGIWICSNGYALPVEPESQDCVFSYYVLEHCAFPERFLCNLLGCVKPGGKLLLTYPDMQESGIFGSQALGWDRHTAREHLQAGRLAHALIRLWYTRVRLPLALSSALSKYGSFPVNLSPQCLETNIKIEPDVDAIYVASRSEVSNWAKNQGCTVSYPGGQEGILKSNVLIQLTKPLS